MLGGDYFVDTRNQRLHEHALCRDKIGYHNDAFVRWGGAFTLLEYKGYLWNAFLNVSAVTQGYKSVDYFAELQEDGQFDERLEVDSGLHHQDRRQLQPERVRQHVCQPRSPQPNAGLPQRGGLQNNFVENTENERINSVEWGYSYSKFPFASTSTPTTQIGKTARCNRCFASKPSKATSFAPT